MTKFFLIVSIVVCALAGASHAADDAPYAPPEFLAAPPTLPPGYDAGRAMRLDLSEALSIAMKHNLGIFLERKQMEASEISESATVWGMYEPTLSGSYNHSGSTQPPSSLQAGLPGDIIRSNTDSWDLTASQRLPTGAQLSLGFSNSRVRSSAGTAVEPLNFSSSLNFSLTQPILRGFSTDLAIPQYSILTAKIATEQQRHQLAISAASLVEQTESAYWDVVQALYSYGVTVKSQQLAEDTLTLVRRQIAAGMVSPSELTGAENTIAQRRIAVLSAGASVEQAWDSLRTVLNLPRDQWDRPLLPIDRPRFEPSVVPSDEAALETATKRRPEIAESDLDLKSSALALRKAKNDLLPQIDVGITGSIYGQSTTYGGALRELGAHDATGWGAMATLTWTPMNRANKASAQIAQIQHEIKISNREQRIQGIWNEVRSAVRNQRAAALQVVAASQSRKLASESLEIETRKYQTGSSSNLNIATLQNGLASAELTELQALLGHEKAAAQLLLATGQLLEHRHINLLVDHK
jgi:outer membrane protein TolC